MTSSNAFGQPIGDSLGTWTPPEPVEPTALDGRHMRLEPLQRTRHAIPLFHAYRNDDESLWTYMPWGPFVDAAELGQLCDRLASLEDWVPYAVVVDGEPVGMCCYLRMDPPGGVIEIGGIAWAPALQRTTASTEAIILLIQQAFDSGYRRVEWKCDDLNAPSRSAAERFGFTYEGTFRQATHYKGRNRDTAWFAITDGEWPRLQTRLATWMDPANFDEQGRQRRSLSQILVGR